MRGIVLVLMAAVLIAPAALADIVVNGDFETGDLTGWTWTPDEHAEPAMVATVAWGPWGSDAFRVNPGCDATGEPDSGGTLSQMVSLTGGTEYSITGDLAIEDTGGGENYDGGTITVMLNDTLLHEFVSPWPLPGGETAFDTIDAVYTPPASGDYDFSVRFTRSHRNETPAIYHWADNLSIVLPEPGDLDGDGDVDLDDFNIFAGCMTGPDVPTTSGCEPADLHADGDVDLADFAVFQMAFTGSI